MTTTQQDRRRGSQPSTKKASKTKTAKRPSPEMVVRLEQLAHAAEHNPAYVFARVNHAREAKRGIKRAHEEPAPFRRRHPALSAPKYAEDGVPDHQVYVGSTKAEPLPQIDPLTGYDLDAPVRAADGGLYDLDVMQRILSNGEGISPLTGAPVTGGAMLYRGRRNRTFADPAELGPINRGLHRRLRPGAMQVGVTVQAPNTLGTRPKMAERDFDEDENPILTDQEEKWQKEEADVKNYWLSRVEQAETANAYKAFQRKLSDWKKMPKSYRRKNKAPVFDKSKARLSRDEYADLQAQHDAHIEVYRNARVQQAIDDGQVAEYLEAHGPMAYDPIAQRATSTLPKAQLAETLMAERSATQRQPKKKGFMQKARDWFSRLGKKD